MSANNKPGIPEWKEQLPSSPAWVLDRQRITHNLEILQQLKLISGCKILYSIKALPHSEVIEWCLPYVDGFSVSSLFEARLAHEISAGQGSLHLTTPGLKQGEINEISSYCSHISFNSTNQFQQLTGALNSSTSRGLRINPQLSFASDPRFDPCRSYSKLGVNLEHICVSGLPDEIEGLHFHTVFSSDNFKPLLKTIDRLQSRFNQQLKKLRWINLGGGYLYNSINRFDDFVALIKRLRKELKVEIYIEPGNAVVNDAGYLLATVVDHFESEGKYIAILDTSVNHNPEVFEYQKQADLCEHDPNGDYQVLLAGSTCLAGDLFGDYRFNQAVKTGDRVIFKQLGAYSLVKAHRFNGYNLPDIYSYDNNQLSLLKHYTYADFKNHWSKQS